MKNTKISPKASGSEDQLKVLRKMLKRQLKINKMNYSDVAKVLDVSESTVKRWMTSGDFSIETLSKIAKLVNFHVADLLKINHDEDIQHHVYTKAQEQYLSKNPLANAVLLKTIYGYSIEDCQNIIGITKAQVIRYLRGLDRVGFIELHEQEKIKVLKKGPFRARPDGDFEQKYFKAWSKLILNNFLLSTTKMRASKKEATIEIFRPFELYLPEDLARLMQEELIDVISKYRNLGANSSDKNSKFYPYTGFVGFKQWDSFLDTYQAAERLQSKSEVKLDNSK